MTIRPRQQWQNSPLDGFEFLSMADVHELAIWAVEVQREHVETVRRASLTLAVQEITAEG